MISVTDQMGREVTVPQRPTRIISLVPSQTELLFDLGLDDKIVGVTKFCVHPAEQVADKQSVGGTKKFRFDVIDRLQPDLIIGNKEENYREGILQLAKTYPVWLSDIFTLADACAMIRQVGTLVGKAEKANLMAERIQAAFVALKPVPRPLRVGYFIWQKPVMAVGRHTFIHEMLSQCGFANAFADMDNGRYPELTFDDIHTAQLDAILLSSEPFPFREKHKQVFADAFPETAVYLVDGEMFSWYGSRLETAVNSFQQLINSLAGEETR
ncbi:MAG: helical backbone metal receptor [Chloroflexota bacterium]